MSRAELRQRLRDLQEEAAPRWSGGRLVPDDEWRTNRRNVAQIFLLRELGLSVHDLDEDASTTLEWLAWLCDEDGLTGIAHLFALSVEKHVGGGS